MEFVQIKRRVRGKSRSFWWCMHYSAIWSNSREHSKNVFAVNLGHRNNVDLNFDEKHSPNVLEDQTRLQDSTDTTRKSLIFRELYTLFENNLSGINRDFLKHPTWSGAKNSNNLCAPSHLVTCFPRTPNYSREMSTFYKGIKKISVCYYCDTQKFLSLKRGNPKVRF